MGRSSSNGRWATAVFLAFCTTLPVMLPEVSAKRFIVGGNMGWTSNVNYTLWAGNQTFYLDDWLFFVYDRNQNDVLEVNKTNYATCNAEDPVHNFTTGAGRDVVALNVTHDRYFISSGSCDGGMKLHVHLSPLPPPPRTAPAILPPSPHAAPATLPLPPRAAPATLPLPPSAAPATLPLPPRAAPATLPQPSRGAPAKGHSSRFTALRSQFIIPAAFTMAAVWDSIIFRL